VAPTIAVRKVASAAPTGPRRKAAQSAGATETMPTASPIHHPRSKITACSPPTTPVSKSTTVAAPAERAGVNAATHNSPPHLGHPIERGAKLDAAAKDQRAHSTASVTPTAIVSRADHGNP
jgi:hypothetical protein